MERGVKNSIRKSHQQSNRSRSIGIAFCSVSVLIFLGPIPAISTGLIMVGVRLIKNNFLWRVSYPVNDAAGKVTG